VIRHANGRVAKPSCRTEVNAYLLRAPHTSNFEGAAFDVPLEILCGSWLQPRHKKSANDLVPFGGLFAEPCSPAREEFEKLTACASLHSFSQLPIIVAMKSWFRTVAAKGVRSPWHPSSGNSPRR